MWACVAGAHLSTPGAAGGTAASQAATSAGPATPGAQGGAGVIKQYRHAGADLPSRFADQFSVWRWAGAGPCEGAQVGATLVRLPLRTKAQAASAAALSKVGLTVLPCQQGRLAPAAFAGGPTVEPCSRWGRDAHTGESACCCPNENKQIVSCSPAPAVPECSCRLLGVRRLPRPCSTSWQLRCHSACSSCAR